MASHTGSWGVSLASSIEFRCDAGFSWSFPPSARISAEEGGGGGTECGEWFGGGGGALAGVLAGRGCAVWATCALMTLGGAVSTTRGGAEGDGGATVLGGSLRWSSAVNGGGGSSRVLVTAVGRGPFRLAASVPPPIEPSDNPLAISSNKRAALIAFATI